MFEINEVSVGRGVVGMMPIPKSLHDVSKVKEWAPDAILSLTEIAEFDRLAAPEFLSVLTAPRWVLPIGDFGVPREHQRQKSDQILNQARGVLYKSGRVLIHCRGGCGRTGMLVLRLMIAEGEPAERALKRLRQARQGRPCTIETDDQLAWACGV